MELINPLGREDGGEMPRACYCSDIGAGTGAENFAEGRGVDSCANCGCYCDNYWGFTYGTNNYYVVAKSTDRKSYL